MGVDLIAEPWAVGDGTFQFGGFPNGWAEWNGKFRDSLRTSQNKLGVATGSRLNWLRALRVPATCFNGTAESRVPGKPWYRVADTAAWMETRDNFNAPGQEELITSANYALGLAARTVLLLIEK
jgi:hypothetical protein